MLENGTSGNAALKAKLDEVLTNLATVKAYTDSVEGSLATIAGYTDSVEGTLSSIWGDGYYGLVGARNEASYGRVALRTQMDALFNNYTWGHGNYGQVAARDEATWGRVAIRNRVEDVYGQANAANAAAATARDNAWHAIDARAWVHAAVHGGNAWSLPQIRALLDDIRNIAIAARDNAAAANSNAAAAVATRYSGTAYYGTDWGPMTYNLILNKVA
jgi:hypothetical protein